MDGKQPDRKMQRKHSSGDLHSRLKTRKLLGVGETDDGDVHRSKLSQILGHSEQLYIRLPRGLRIWQVITAIMFTVMGAWALVFPRNLFSFALEGEAEENAAILLPIRLYGAALISFSIIFWCTAQSQDKDVIRWSLLSSAVYFTIQVIVWTMCSSLPGVFSLRGTVLLLCPVLHVAPTIYVYVVLLGRPHHHYQ